MAVDAEVDSEYTGMVLLLRRLFPEFLDGRPRNAPRPDVAIAVRRSRRR